MLRFFEEELKQQGKDEFKKELKREEHKFKKVENLNELETSLVDLIKR